MKKQSGRTVILERHDSPEGLLFRGIIIIRIETELPAWLIKKRQFLEMRKDL